MTPSPSRHGKMRMVVATAAAAAAATRGDDVDDDEEAAVIVPLKDKTALAMVPTGSSNVIKAKEHAEHDNNDDNDDDNDIFPPLEQSHMGSTQRDVTLALQLSFFAILYGSTAHSASRAMRLLYVMLALMVYLPRIMPLPQHSPALSHDTILLVAMGGFLYWFVLTPTWLCHLLMVFGIVLLVLQGQALWRTMCTSSSSSSSSSSSAAALMRPLLRTLHVVTILSSIVAMVTCLLLWPHYLSFHCAMDAYVLYAVAAVLQAKLDHIAAATCALHADEEDNDDDDHLDGSNHVKSKRQPSSSPSKAASSTSPRRNNDDHQHHSCTTNSTTTTCSTTILFSTNFAVGLQRQSLQHRFLLRTVIGSLILPLVLSVLLLVACVWWPDAPWLAQLASLVWYATLWPLWMLTTEPSQPALSKLAAPDTSSSSWSISNTLAMIWTMPLRIHVRSDASIVIEALANTIVYEHAVSACYHYYGKTVVESETTAHHHHRHPSLAMDHHKKEEDAPPTPPTRRRRRRAAVRQQVVLVELQGSRFLRLAPEDPEGLIMAIHTAAAAAAVAQSKLDPSRHSESVIVVPLSSNNTSHATFVDVEMNPTR